MPRLSNVKLKAMALTGNPANRRPIHAKKSAQKETPMSSGAPDSETPMLAEPNDAVLKALADVQLSKSVTQEGRTAAEAVGRILASCEGMTLADVVKVAQAAGIAKADEDEDEEDEDDGDEMDAQKSVQAAPEAKEPAEMNLDQLLKSAEGPVAKAVREMQAAHQAEREAMQERIAKSERMVTEERDHRVMQLTKSEMQATFKNLSVDHGKLAQVIKHARENGQKEHADELMRVLRSADSQLALARKSGASPFDAVGKSTSFQGAGNSAMDRINAAVDGLVQKSGGKKTRPECVSDFLATEEGRTAWAEQMMEGRN